MNKKTSLLLVLGLISSTTLGVQAITPLSAKAQTAAEKQAQKNAPVLQSQLPAASTPQQKVAPTVEQQRFGTPDAVLCYSCGGDYPYYGGTIPTASAANELGSGCSGTFSTARNDRFPYLCTK